MKFKQPPTGPSTHTFDSRLALSRTETDEPTVSGLRALTHHKRRCAKCCHKFQLLARSVSKSTQTLLTCNPQQGKEPDTVAQPQLSSPQVSTLHPPEQLEPSIASKPSRVLPVARPWWPIELSRSAFNGKTIQPMTSPVPYTRTPAELNTGELPTHETWPLNKTLVGP